MRRTLAFLSLLVFAAALNSDGAAIALKPKALLVIKSMSKAMVRQYEMSSAMPWLFASSGELVAFQDPSRKTMRVFSPNFTEEREIDGSRDSFSSPKVGLRCLVRDGIERFAIMQAARGYCEVVIKKGKNEKYLFAVDNLALFKDSDSGSYVGYIVKEGGAFERLKDEALFAYARDRVPELRLDGQTLYYRDNPLRFAVDQFDDDGNFYESNVVVVRGIDSYEISLKNGKYPCPFFFDNEGNLWTLDISKGGSPVLSYSGREWGYASPPIKALTKGNATIRLRAAKDGFALGTLTRGQAVSVLKVGASETIGGLTSPWYRIKTAEGLIGWVFGSTLSLQS